jgi:hypothetical protein
VEKGFNFNHHRQPYSVFFIFCCSFVEMNNSGKQSGRGVMISSGEIERMRRSVQPTTENYAREQKKAHLKHLSNEKLKHWPNTLEALRLKKESFLKEKAGEEELKRVEIDREEAEIRRKTRIESIERADKLVYEQTDKMKFLRSQQLYSDAIYTRGFQVQEKKERALKEKEADLVHHKDILRQVEAAERIEREKEEVLEKKIKEVAISRQEQLDEVRQAREQARKEQIEIGISLKSDAIARLEEEKIQRIERERRNRESNEAMTKSNAALKEIRDELQAAEEEAMRRREDEVGVIENRKKVRKALEVRKFEKAQVTRQKMIDAATKALASQSNKEQFIMDKQAGEQRAKEDKAILDKETKRTTEWNNIVESRAAQVQRRKDEKIATAIADEKVLKATLQDSLIKAEVEVAKERKAREATIANKRETYQTAIEIEKARKEQRKIENEHDMKFKNQIQKEDDKFTRVCKKEIERYAADGKPLYPLYKALEQKPQEIMAVSGFRI